MTTPAVHDCPFCRGVGCPHCGGGDVDDRELCQAPTAPGLYDDIPEAVYHGDVGSLSSSGARTLLRPGGPELFRHQREHGSGHSAHFDEGHAAHTLLLGAGPEIVEIEAKDWKTKAAQEARRQAYAEGKVPLLSATLREIEEMVATARQHPVVAELLVGGKPEVSAYALDEKTWTMLRARFDYLREEAPGEYLFVDYKTTAAEASPAGFASSSAKYRYPVQEGYYRFVLRLLRCRVSRALFIVQEKEPPYRLTVNEHQPGDLAVADRLVRRAIDIYAECVAADHWPGYGTDINPITMPAWAIREWEALLA